MAALIERYSSVLYPFPIESVLDRLPARGWLVPFADRDEGGLKLAGLVSKGNVKLAFDLGNKTLGVRGIEPTETLAEFQELSQFLMADFGLGPEVTTHYLEWRFTGSVDLGSSPKRNPTELLEDWWDGHDRSAVFAQVMEKLLPGDPIGVYGIRMATKGKAANRPNWTELTLAPDVTAGTRFYNFDLIYRNEDKILVERVAADATAIVIAAIEELER